MDSVDVGANAALRNDGLMKRRAIGSESREFDMMGRLHADIFYYALQYHLCHSCHTEFLFQSH